MGIRVSTASPVIPEGLGCVIYDQHGMYQNGNENQKKSGSVFSQQGGKGINQDAAVLCQGFGTEEGILCAVFDGHGRYGHLVSKIVRERLPVLLLERTNAVASNMESENFSENQVTTDGDVSSDKNFLRWKTSCVNAFEEMDEEIKLMKKVDCSFSGTTAVVVLKQDDDLLIANLGDSRAVLGTKTEDGVSAVQLTIDLKPGTPDEAARIRKSNGRVFALREEPGVARAWLPRIQCPGIAMSRCFGDFVMKKHGLISTPVVTHHPLSSDDLFLVLASDGVWDVLTNEEVVSIVSKVEREEMASEAVVKAARAAWKTRLPMAQSDDITVVCLFLQNKDQTLSTTPRSSLSS